MPWQNIPRLQASYDLTCEAVHKDIIFQSDDGSGGVADYLTLDGGLGHTTVQKSMLFADNVQAQFGAGTDFKIYHDGTDSLVYNYTGHLYIRNNADDKDIVFQSDDGSGGVTDYLTIDGSSRNISVDIASYMDIKSADGSEGGISLSKSATDATHTKYSISHRDDNQSLIIYSYDGTTFRNWFTAAVAKIAKYKIVNKTITGKSIQR